MQQGNSLPLTPKLAAELSDLEALPDAEIDTSDIPVVHDWTGAKRGNFYRPIKRQGRRQRTKASARTRSPI
jgi:hypothetical protein